MGFVVYAFDWIGMRWVPFLDSVFGLQNFVAYIFIDFRVFIMRLGLEMEMGLWLGLVSVGLTSWARETKGSHKLAL